MNLQELIDFHINGAEACEAYAITPGASEAKNKDIAKHYSKRAKWHRDAVELMKAAQHQGEPVTVQPKTPGTMVLVPRNATPRMIEAAIGIYEKDGSYAEMFGAMCEAAPVEIDLTPRRLAHAESVIEQQNNLIASLRAELVDSRGEPVTFDFEAAAQKVASCMDYPWDHMPDQGKDAMRGHAKAIVSAALTGPEQAAPVAVVMPERKTKADYSGYIEQFQSEAVGLYNSALDDVARLNGVNQ